MPLTHFLLGEPGPLGMLVIILTFFGFLGGLVFAARLIYKVFRKDGDEFTAIQLDGSKDGADERR